MMVTSLLSFLDILLQQSLGKGVTALLLTINSLFPFMLGDSYNKSVDQMINGVPLCVSSSTSFVAEEFSGSDSHISVSTDSTSTSISIVVDSLSNRQIIDVIEKKLEKVINKVEPTMSVDSILNLNITVGAPVADVSDTKPVEESKFYFMGNLITDPDLQQFAMLITLVLSIICFGIPFLALIVVVGLILRTRMKYQREKLQAIESIIKSGHQLPGILMNDGGCKPADRRKQFASAVKWLAVGAGIIIFFGLVAQSSTAVITLGTVPLLVGIVKLVLFFYDSHTAAGDEEEKLKIFPPQFKGFDDSSEEEL